jgi:hypothetical protein
MDKEFIIKILNDRIDEECRICDEGMKKIKEEYDIKLAKINEDRDIARALILEELNGKAHRICLEIRKLEQS